MSEGESNWGSPLGSDKPEELQAHRHRRATDPKDGMWYLHKRVDDCEKFVTEIKRDINDLKEKNAMFTDQFLQMNSHIARMTEILEAWNNAKGFWAVTRFMSNFAKVMMFLGGMAAAIWIFLKTGHWVKWDE